MIPCGRSFDYSGKYITYDRKSRQKLLSEFSGVLPAVQVRVYILPVEDRFAFKQRLYALQYEFARGGGKALETV